MSVSHGLIVTSRGEVRGWSSWNIANRLESCRAEREMTRSTPIASEAHLKKWLRGKGDVTEQEITKARAALASAKGVQS
jgi:hypothetical protein